jgi:hypothetical protein
VWQFPQILAVSVEQIEGEHREPRTGGSPAAVQAGKVGSPFCVWQHELAIDDCRTTGTPLQGVCDCNEPPGPIIAAAAVEPHVAAFLDDLQPVTVEFGSCTQSKRRAAPRWGRDCTEQ